MSEIAIEHELIKSGAELSFRLSPLDIQKIEFHNNYANREECSKDFSKAKRNSVHHELVETLTSSTNDYLNNASLNWKFRVLSINISIIQIIILVLIIVDNPYIGGVLNLNKVLLYLFVSMYLSMSLVDSLSDDFLDNYSLLKYCECCFQLQFVLILITSLIMPFQLLFTLDYKKLPTIIEFTINGLVIIASVFVINNQSDNILNILFNFAGILIVLDLDDMIAKKINLVNIISKLRFDEYTDEELKDLESGIEKEQLIKYECGKGFFDRVNERGGESIRLSLSIIWSVITFIFLCVV